MANKTGFIDPTGVKAGEYFSRIISWYTKGVSCKPFCWLSRPILANSQRLVRHSTGLR